MMAMKWKSRLAAAGMVLGGLAAGEAVAGDVFRGCSDNKTQALRAGSVQVNSAAACGAKETARTWHESGAAAPATVYSQHRTSLDINLPFAHGLPYQVGALNLPAGSYMVMATVNLQNFSGQPDDRPRMTCALEHGGEVSGNSTTLDPGVGLNIPVLWEGTLASAGTVTLVCTQSGGPAQIVNLFGHRLTATPVGAIERQ
ncbi:MAG: hypothetical protein V4729_06145 [Pseudomonadota bacterium]